MRFIQRLSFGCFCFEFYPGLLGRAVAPEPTHTVTRLGSSKATEVNRVKKGRHAWAASDSSSGARVCN